jgi:hypothetical protein
MIILFTDMFQSDSGDDALFSALQHLKHNKHKVVLFHVVDTIRTEFFLLIIRLGSSLMWRRVNRFCR